MPAVVVDRNRLNFSWLIKLRWWSIAGQIATIFGVDWLFSIHLPLSALSAIVVLEAASNVACQLFARRARRIEEWHVASVMALDVLLLTGLLYFTGGPFNPFSFLYLVNISLAAVALQAQWTWMLVALSLGSFGLLFVDFRELPLEHLEPGDQAGILQQGMWVAFGVAAGFIVHFLWRVTGALSEREHELREARRGAERQERLASLATMAAGAAHELSTPLGTIALVAKELERSLNKQEGSPEAIEDLRLIRDQVGRCRVILDQMSAGAGKSAELVFEKVTVDVLLEEATTGVRSAPAVKVELAVGVGGIELELPVRAVAQALRSLVTNAQDATRSGQQVLVRCSGDDDGIRIAIEDGGEGMSAQVLGRIGEPFFTTKAPGSGMGLGIYLGRVTIEKLGGRLEISSQQGEGTQVSVSLPSSRDARRASAASTMG
ncbi:MAG: sensor histidine kinase [Deltaproteobacteria bacterium]|nr:sensor histidine kinase [Deltaproteobacteria bacterium]